MGAPIAPAECPVACHRILIVGPPASGRGWLAERIHALTGIAIQGDGPEGADARADRSRRDLELHEWVVLATRAADVSPAVAAADLVVLVRTPSWLRHLRLLLRKVTGSPIPGGLRLALRETRRWAAEEWPAMRAIEGFDVPRFMTCQSSDDVRAVLECVLGIDEQRHA